MINTDRIVPITAVDLISMYGLILQQDSNNAGLAALKAEDAVGNFVVDDGTNPLIAAEPVASVEIDAEVSAFTLYFVPAYDYAGFKDATIADNGVEVAADGRSLYKAVLATGTVTITKVGF